MLNPSRNLYKWGPIEACPLFLAYSISPAFKPLFKKFGVTYSESFIYFKDERATWILDLKDLVRQSETFCSKNILQEEKFEKYLLIWRDASRRLSDSIKKFDSFKGVSNDDVVKQFKEFSSIYKDWFSATISHELSTVSLEQALKEELKKIITDEKEFNDALAVLSAPDKISFYRRERRDLMRILLKADDREELVQKHQKKYFWIYNSYAKAKVLPVDSFRAELERIEDSDWRSELQEIVNYSSKIRTQKSKIIQRYLMSGKIQKLSHRISIFAVLLDERKELNFQADHVLELFVQEFGKRCDIAPDNLKLLLPEELELVFNYYSQKEINERKKSFAISISKDSSEIFSGEKTLSIIKKFEQGKVAQNRVIQGTVASQGQYRHFRGIAKKVLRIDQINKIKKGEILVTTMTSPDFVIGMRKAGAIITDVGGMLSHAAIISREFEIPCIVGTNIATKIINDGDIVELHCLNGTIRVIKTT